MKSLRKVAALLLGIAWVADAAPPTTQDFFRQSQFQHAKLSPSGQALALTVPVENKVNLAIFGDVGKQPLTPTGRFSVKGDGNVYRFHWMNDNTLIFDSTELTARLAVPVLRNDLFRVNLADNTVSNMFNNDFVHFIGIFKDSQHALVEVHGEAQDLDVDTGKFKRITSAADLDYLYYFADHKGQVRIALGWEQQRGFSMDSKVVIQLRDPATDKWKQRDWEQDDVEGERPLKGLGFSADDKTFYFASDEDSTTYGVYAIDLENSEKKLLYRDPDHDVGDAIYDTDGKTPIGVMASLNYSHPVFFDENSASAKLLREIYGLFPEATVNVTSFSNDGKRALALVYSDHRPTRCYLVDLNVGEVRELLNAAPWIDPRELSPVRTVHLKARDDLKLEGFLTLPAKSNGKNLPLVVLPHGGPFGINDAPDYDPEVQFLAYHGYAVLQVNYRGSSGYGREFLRAGFKQWGEKIQDDILDAVHWTIDQGVADRNRVCIVGASFGAYSAMEAPIREPGLFKCAVGYSGVYDLKLLLKGKGGGRWLHHTLGEYNSHLDDFSPDLHADKIGIPVFLAHGEEDRIAPIDQYESMADALKAAGNPAQLMRVPKEMHGFYKLENQVAFYDRLLAFLDKYIGSAAKQDRTPATPAAASITGS